MLKWLMVGIVIGLMGCTTGGGIVPVGPDPTVSWTAPTTNCDGGPVTAGTGINIYAVSGAGPMPTVAVTGLTPAGCNGNQIDQTKATKLNAAPITTASTVVSVASAGVWTFCVEAVDPSGNRSLISNCQTKTVANNPNAPNLLNVAGVQIIIRVG